MESSKEVSREIVIRAILRRAIGLTRASLEEYSLESLQALYGLSKRVIPESVSEKYK